MGGPTLLAGAAWIIFGVIGLAAENGGSWLIMATVAFCTLLLLNGIELVVAELRKTRKALEAATQGD